MSNVLEEARRDAKRYAEAQMNYGKGAGTQRKLLEAELSKKMKDITYKQAFDYALERIDKSEVLKTVKQKKGFQKVANTAKKGYYAARRAGNFYNRNRSWIDSLVSAIFKD